MKRPLLTRGVSPGTLKLPAASENGSGKMARPKRYASGFLAMLATVFTMGVSAASAADRFVATTGSDRSEEHTSELQSQSNIVCRLLLEKKNITMPICK